MNLKPNDRVRFIGHTAACQDPLCARQLVDDELARANSPALNAAGDCWDRRVGTLATVAEANPEENALWINLDGKTGTVSVIPSHVELCAAYPTDEHLAICLEAARIALQDAEIFDSVGDTLDVNDATMRAARDQLTAYLTAR